MAEVPADAFSWPKVGVVSSKPVLTFNERILRTPYAVRIDCDRTRTSGVEAAFRSAKSPEMDKGSEGKASFVRHDTGPDAGMYVLSLRGKLPSTITGRAGSTRAGWTPTGTACWRSASATAGSKPACRAAPVSAERA